MSLNVRIITPEKVFLTSETEQVVLPSITGGVGILKVHARLVTIVAAHPLRYTHNGTWTPADLAADGQALIDATTNLEDV